MSPGSDEQGPDTVDICGRPSRDVATLGAPERSRLDELGTGSWSEDRSLRPGEQTDLWSGTAGETEPDTASRPMEDYLQRRRRRDEETSLVEYGRRPAEPDGSLGGPTSLVSAPRSKTGAGRGQGSSLRLPDVGDEVFGFRLCHPLGQGAFGRVFAAEQVDLAGRPVVLKITAIEGDEPQTLAQLLHTNIVPIYSLHEDHRAGLRAFSMPYLGGASLSDVLAELWAESSRPSSGEQLVLALEAVEAPKFSTFSRNKDRGAETATPEGTRVSVESVAEGAVVPLATLRELSYERAVAWIVAQLADGLHHAHQRGILHRDIKPSNILISAEGQALLLDFNVSQAHDRGAEHATIGGTVTYMSPEHLRALIDHTPDAVRRVDRRSDIYSLGMVLAEMITGRCPFGPSVSHPSLLFRVESMALERSRSVPSIRRARPDISWGLESIARECLASDPSRRYQRADHLSEDLRRLLDDRPLRYAPELSRVERARKFVRRHPRLTSSAAVAGVAALVLLAVGSALAGVRDQLADTRARDLVRAHDAGIVRALCLVHTRLDLQDHLRDGIAACERTLALFGAPEDPEWDRHPAWLRIPPPDRRRLAEDRRELLLLLADARVRLADGSGDSVAVALRLLDRAESIPGLPASRALWLDRARYHSLRGEVEQARSARRHAEQTPATTARDHYLLATSIARQGGPGGLKAAITELDEALRRNPRHYWSLVQRGICRMELGELVEAAADFGQCAGIWPEFAWSYFNRGCVLDRAGNKAAAIVDFSAALARDPGLIPAYINRGLGRLELKQYASALDDFGRAEALGVHDASVSAGRGVALEGLGRHREADAAFADCFARAGGLPAATRARLCWAYGFAISARDHDKALAAFDRALDHNPRDFQALYGRAMLAMCRGENAEALRDFDRALEADPGRIEARRYRAIVLARQGDWERAIQEINRCLEREPRSAATLYAAACVMARAFGATGATANSSQSLDLLERALAEGADPARSDDDPDLAAIRRFPRFRRLIGEAKGSALSRR